MGEPLLWKHEYWIEVDWGGLAATVAGLLLLAVLIVWLIAGKRRH